MFNKSKTNNVNPPTDEPVTNPVEDEEMASEAPENTVPTPSPAPAARGSMMDMITTTANKPSILSEGFYFKGELSAKGTIHVEGSLNGQVQVDELTIGSRGQVDGIVNCKNFHIKGRFSGTATCEELTVTSSATVDGHVVYKTLSVQKGASIKGELLLAK